MPYMLHILHSTLDISYTEPQILNTYDIHTCIQYVLHNLLYAEYGTSELHYAICTIRCIMFVYNLYYVLYSIAMYEKNVKPIKFNYDNTTSHTTHTVLCVLFKKG